MIPQLWLVGTECSNLKRTPETKTILYSDFRNETSQNPKILIQKWPSTILIAAADVAFRLATQKRKKDRWKPNHNGENNFLNCRYFKSKRL